MMKDKFENILHKLENSLKFLNDDKFQYIMILSKDTAAGAFGTVIPRIYNPSSLEMILSSFFESTKSLSATKYPKRLYEMTSEIMMKSVRNFMDGNQDIFDEKKYRQFKSGNIKGLTDDEINNFISIASSEAKINKTERNLQLTFNMIFDYAVEISKVNNALSYHLYQDCNNIFGIFVKNNFDLSKSDMNKICYDTLTKIYGKRKVISTFALNWSTEIFNRKSKLLSLLTVNE